MLITSWSVYYRGWDGLGNGCFRSSVYYSQWMNVKVDCCWGSTADLRGCWIDPIEGRWQFIQSWYIGESCRGITRNIKWRAKVVARPSLHASSHQHSSSSLHNCKSRTYTVYIESCCVVTFLFCSLLLLDHFLSCVIIYMFYYIFEIFVFNYVLSSSNWDSKIA